jgi:hypothetical protein
MWFICIPAGQSNLSIMHDMVSAQVFSWSRVVTEAEHLPITLASSKITNLRKGVPIVWWQCQWFWSLPPLNIRKLANFFCIYQWAWDTLLFCAVQKTNANISHYHPTINVEGLQKVPMKANNQKLLHASETHNLIHLSHLLMLSPRPARLWGTWLIWIVAPSQACGISLNCCLEG